MDNRVEAEEETGNLTVLLDMNKTKKRVVGVANTENTVRNNEGNAGGVTIID
jgi:hypothetical protein